VLSREDYQVANSRSTKTHENTCLHACSVNENLTDACLDMHNVNGLYVVVKL